MKRTLRDDQTHITTLSPGKLTASLTRGLLALVLIAGFSLALSAQDDDFLNPNGTYDSPCNAALYNFMNAVDPDNQVPCGPSANTTPSVEIARGQGNSGHINMMDCGANLGNGGSPTDVLWVTFVIQEGGSFEWQTVPGADDFYWELWYTPDMVTDPNVNSGCGNLVYLECGTEFTGWKVQSTPGANRKWRYYLAFYLRDGDMNGDGVVKIRKSCGEGCNESSTDVDVTIAATDDCYNPGDPDIVLTAQASGGGTKDNPNPTYPTDYSFDWSTTEVVPSVSSTESSITVTPTQETTYTVLVTGPDGCPATDEITIEYDCCEPSPGTITADGALDPICPGNASLDGIVFATDAVTQPDGYSYALFLVDMNGNIGTVAANGTSASFTFSALAAGMYTVYGISYKGADAAAFVSGFATLTALETALAGNDCGALTSDGKVTILDLDCGDFPQGAPAPVSSPN